MGGGGGGGRFSKSISVLEFSVEEFTLGSGSLLDSGMVACISEAELGGVN